MAKKSCIQYSYTFSNEFLYNILNKLTVRNPKTKLEFIKDVIGSLSSDYKEIKAFSVASNKGIYWKITWGKRKKLHSLLRSKKKTAIVAKGHRAECTKCNKVVYAKCSLNFDLALYSI